MILLQLSAGQGPIKCYQAVSLAFKATEKQCLGLAITLDIVEAAEARERHCFKSILLQFDTPCQNQHRPKHKRKNWGFSGQMYEIDEAQLDKSVTFQTYRASDAGGQHVNKTDFAVRATKTFSVCLSDKIYH